MKKLALAVALATAATTASGQQVTIKLGTLAPNGSTWHNLLREMGERWAEASGGKVKLKIYPGGTQGSESDMVRKMKVGQLQAAAISNVGMHDIAREPQGISAPGVIASEAEFKAVFAKVEPELDKLLESKGVVPLQWSQIGFANIFCTKPYKTPAEMADAKMFAWDGDPASVEAWAAAGFKPVVISSTDVMPSLQTGLINCIANVPLYMLTTRLFERTRYMINYPWGYLVGGTLVNKDTWQKVPADLRPKLLAIAQEVGAKVDQDVRKLNEDAISAMKQQGLQVLDVDPTPWRRAAEKAWPVVRGEVVPAAFFDQVLKARDAYRAGGGGK
jgi:TRAP-type C4-dicarboxylate transport system substrate-binding protein